MMNPNADLDIVYIEAETYEDQEGLLNEASENGLVLDGGWDFRIHSEDVDSESECPKSSGRPATGEPHSLCANVESGSVPRR